MATPRWHPFLAELKRRKVFRVAAVYGATGFVVLQAADLVFPRLGLPDWTVTLVVALGLAGLPIALVLAWAFDATPEGLRRTDPADSEELAAIAAQPRARRWTAGFAALAGVVLLAGGAWWTLASAGPRPGASSRPACRSASSRSMPPTGCPSTAATSAICRAPSNRRWPAWWRSCSRGWLSSSTWGTTTPGIRWLP